MHDGLPAHLRHGIFAEPKTYRAWVRFSGPGPYVTPDIEDVGFMSISIKLLGVPGPKLMEEERHTQDFTCVSTPTFVTQDTKSNAHLQKWSVKNAQLFHFLNLTQPHLLDLIMQGLWIKTQSSPFEAPYFSCVPYLLGEGQAMQYSVWPTSTTRTPIPRLPLRPPDDYLRDAMVAALAARRRHARLPGAGADRSASACRSRTTACSGPSGCRRESRWRRCGFRGSASIQPAQIAFARRLSYNPWHCVPEHRPLGNQSRARRRMYYELSQLRHRMNDVPHYEPTGDEVFE